MWPFFLLQQTVVQYHLGASENAYTTLISPAWTEYTRAGLLTVYTRSKPRIHGIKYMYVVPLCLCTKLLKKVKMAFEIFGYEISRKKDRQARAQQPVVTPVTPTTNGASVVYSAVGGNYSGAAAGYYGYQFDIDGVVHNEAQMINQYRTVSCYPEVDGAIEAIVNEAVIVEQGRNPVSLNLDALPKQYQPLRDTIREHFDHILNVLEFNDNCHDIFKRWYVDGRLYYYVMIDPKNPKKGILDLKYIDPRKIRKMVEYQRENRNGVDVIVGQKSYYIFNDSGLQSAAVGVKLSTDSVINVRSGLIDANTGEVISHLFKGIKPANQLKMMEDALVIYRITRAPERRVFYVDVGNLPGLKAEQYVNNVMNKFRNKVVYDAETGEVKNNRNYLSMCFTMDTKVRLVDGRVLTLDEMSHLYQTEDLEVYSCDPDTGHRTIGKVQWAGITGHNRDVMILTLSNGCNITCTPDHRFVVQKGGFVEAKDLSVGEQLLTLSDECCTVVSKQACEDRCDVGCLRVDNEYHTFALDADVFVHNCEDFFLPRREGGKATEIQTLPGCLSMDTKVSLLDGRELSIHDIEHEMKQGKQLWTYSCHPETGKVVPGLITWAGVTQKSAKVMKLTLDNGETITCTPDHKFPIKGIGFVRADQLKVNDSLIPLYRRNAQIDSNYKNTYEQYYDNESHEWYFTHRKVVEYVQGLENLIRYNDASSNLKKKELHDPQIVAIQWLDDPIEVGTLTIDIDEIYHNYHTFALSCGVFTKNSQNLSEIADIEYFQKKLYQSLNVPRQRLIPDNVMSIGSPNEVTREELAFAKFIQRLRNRFNVLFKEALRIQLIATNTIRQSDWEKIRNCIYFEYQHDNYFEELKRIEVFNERMTQLQTADGFKGIYFSKQYIVRNVLELSDEQWEEIQQQMKQEKIDEAREAAELENESNPDYEDDDSSADQQGEDDQSIDSQDQEDDGYTDFVDGNDGAPEEVEQSGDTTDTIDDQAEPNPGEDDFDRPATPGLKATM